MSDNNHFCCPENLTKHRVKYFGKYGDNQNGMMIIPSRKLKIIFSNGDGWEHVSASSMHKVPTYNQMCWLKEQFWPDEDCVMQLHVPVSDHISNHPNCLHLWRPIDGDIPRPPQSFV